MSPVDVGIAGVVLALVLLFLGMPIGLSMGLTGFLGLMVLTNPVAALSRLGTASLGITLSYTVAVLPLFMLMGQFAHTGGLTGDAYGSTNKWLGRFPGGLAMATIFGCAAFAAVCGSSIATTTTMATISLPEMRKYRYADILSLPTLAAGGTLGILIPPSAAFVLYGIITEQSIGKLLIAGIFPGILLTFLFILAIYVWVKCNPRIGPPGPSFSWKEKLSSLKNIWGVVILFVVVMGGIWGGIFTTTEAAAIGCFCAVIITILRRKFTPKNIVSVIRDTCKTTGMVFLILIGSILFGYFLAQSRLTLALVNFIAGLAMPPIAVLIAIMLLYFVLGTAMDEYAMLMICTPILFPAIVKLGIDPIWFGVLTVIMMEVAMLSPPVGMNMFVMKGVAPEVPMSDIFKGSMVYLVAMLVCVALLVAFPSISLFLPNIMITK